MIKEPIPYIANIILVAYADGKLSNKELAQLDAIRKEHGFKKSDYTAAIKLAESGKYVLKPVGSFADQVKNLELILRVACVDSDLRDREANMIQAFSTTIGITKEQLDRLRSDILASLKRSGKVCISCGAENSSGSRFCGKCGSNLIDSGKDVQVQVEIPTSGIAIEFAESPAASFPKALEIAKTNKGFQKYRKEGKKTWYLTVYPGGKIEDTLPLVESLTRIRNRRLYIDGEEQQWDEVFAFTWCTSLRETAYRPVEYCFSKDENRLNPWGCKLSRMEWTDWAKWFCFGRWEEASTGDQKVQWRFDKERIKHELATNLYRFRYCPHINTNLSEAVLKYLPDTVVPVVDENWDFHRNYDQVPGSIKIVQKGRSDGFITVTNEFWADGVRPIGLKVLADILVKAFRELGMESSSVRAFIE